MLHGILKFDQYWILLAATLSQSQCRSTKRGAVDIVFNTINSKPPQLKISCFPKLSRIAFLSDSGINFERDFSSLRSEELNFPTR